MEDEAKTEVSVHEELSVEGAERPSSAKRLVGALIAYGLLAGLAALQLRGKVLYAVLILFAGLAAKTLIADKAGWR